MTEDELTEEYLSNFPTIFCNALINEPKVRKKFLRTVKTNYKDLKVYRAIRHEDYVVEEDFLSYAETAIRNGEEYRKNQVEWYSVSVNTDKEHLITRMDIPNEDKKLLGIASGIMKSEFGPADFLDNKTHHNWYLYKGAETLLKNRFVVEKIERSTNEIIKGQIELDNKKVDENEGVRILG